mgnify:CR=1 FL=1
MFINRLPKQKGHQPTPTSVVPQNIEKLSKNGTFGFKLFSNIQKLTEKCSARLYLSFRKIFPQTESCCEVRATTGILKIDIRLVWELYGPSHRLPVTF